MPELLVSIDGHVQVIQLGTVAALERFQRTMGEDKKPVEATQAMCMAYYATHDTLASLDEIRAWATDHTLMVLDTRKAPDPIWPA
jgi:hypothetical protein